MKQIILLLNFVYVVSSCQVKTVIPTTPPIVETYSADSLKQMKYMHFFDKSQTFNYHQFLQYRDIEEKIPEGIERKNYYSHLALLESYLGNYYTSIELTDKSNLQPTDMVTFSDDGSMTKSLFYPKTAYSTYNDSLISVNYEKIPLSDLLQNLGNETQVFGINEVHGVSLSRSFIYNMLPILKKKGFNYLVLEGLYEEIQEEHNSSIYPLKNAGWLVAETIMGELQRQAKELGFTLVSYDVQGTGSNVTRELQSFQNIQDRIFKNDPNAKIILFAGHSHVSELPIGKLLPFGAQFLEVGIDPLTINQTDYYERNVPINITEPTILKPKNQSNVKSRFDLTLILPKSQEINGRPSWLWQMNRKPVSIQQDKVENISEPFLIESFIEGQSYDGIPIDRIEIKDKNKLPSLALRTGKYRIRLTSKINEISEYSIHVK